MHNCFMRHDSSVKVGVRQLRFQGLSLNQIYERTHIPKTTIRSWISDIKLSTGQKDILKKRALGALQAGRIKVAKIQKDKKLRKEKVLRIKGIKDIDKLTSREFFIAGIALYWAEGFKNKYEHRLGFCNSDPDMIKFYLNWLEKTLGIDNKKITARLSLNNLYKKRVKEIEHHWSQITGIPLSQFTSTFYQKTNWKKKYDGNNYYGVLRIHVKESLDYLLTMRGWIEGLKLSLAA